MSASAARAIRALRASPMPVAIGIVTNRLAACHSPSGSNPTEIPPVDAAPSQAASITPPLPPHSSTRPNRPRPAPTAKAASRWAALASRGPMTATGTRQGLPLSLCSQRTASRSPIGSPAILLAAEVQRRAAGRKPPRPETAAGGPGRWINRSACGSDDVVFAQGLALCDAFVTERRKIEAHIAAGGEPFGNTAPDRRRVLQPVAAEAVGQD